LRIDRAGTHYNQQRHFFAIRKVIASQGEGVGGTGGTIERKPLTGFDKCDRRR